MAPQDHPGRPWEQQDGLEVLDNMILLDLRVILGRVYVSFWNSKYLKIHFVFGLASRSFFYRFLTRNFNVWDFQIKMFASNALQKSTFDGNRFFKLSEPFLIF